MREKNVQHLISQSLDFQLKDFQHVEEKRERDDCPPLLVVFHRSDIHRLKKPKYFRHLQQSSPSSCSVCSCTRDARETIDSISLCQGPSETVTFTPLLAADAMIVNPVVLVIVSLDI